jgi:PRTRC genetic system protein C
MSVTVTPAKRIFCYAGLTFPDPNAALSPEEVKSALAIQYPELASAAINGPEVVGDKLRYQLVTSIGAKG